MILRARFLILCFLFLSMTAELYAQPVKSDHSTFKRLFADWTTAFNHKDLSRSCALFSKSVIADYQNFPPKNYISICNGFKKIFQEKDHRYRYHFKIHHIYHSGDLAVIRITWYLYLYQHAKLISITQDEGMDVLEKNQSGQWQIVNYLAYAKAKSA